MIGVYPGPWTLRELLIAAEAAGRDEWTRNARLEAVVFNLLAKRPVSPDVFNPYVKKSARDDATDVSPREFVQILATNLKARQA